jgi:hypothetical protein
MNIRGTPYMNPWNEDEEIMADNSTVLYIIMNFVIALLLITAVNNNNVNQPCAFPLKQWLTVFSLILTSNSLVAIYGIGI